MGCLKLTEYKQKLPRQWTLLCRDFRRKNAEGKWVYYAYDVKGQKIAEWGENTYPTRYEFDAFGNMISLYTFRNPNAVITSEPSPADGDKTAWNYDVASNMLLSKTFANNKANTYTYNLTGTLKSRTWARGITTSYTYDNFKQLLKTSYSDNTPAITNTYFANGALKTVADNVGTTTFTYNQYGDKIKESVSGSYIKRVLSRNFDHFGREINYSIGNLKKAEYSYDESNGRLKIMNAVNGGNFEFGYMENTSLQNRIIYPNGMVKNTSFEEKRNLITGINYQNGANVISNYSYENDVLGRRNNIGITYDNATKSNDYNYNPRSEVIGAHGDTLNQAFDYDNIGNRITSSNNDITTNYSTNNLNQYETVGDFVPLFDADGNQTKIKTSKGEFLVAYNGENRPIKFTNLSDSTFITMKYDYMGRRGGKLHFNSQGTWTSTVKFFYKDFTLIEESTASNDVLKEFVWDPTAGQATKPLYMRVPQTGSNLLYLHDANKNVTELALFATQNGIGAHYEYSPFGETIVSTKNTPVISQDFRTYNPFRFSSEYHDDELGLIYYNYRHYNPQSGRWISRDPIAEEGGNNLYGMCNNNTINSFDLKGNGIVDEWNDLMDELSDKINRSKEMISAFSEILKMYMEMRERNIIGADKYFHCMGMCNATRKSGNPDFVLKLAIYREAFDNFKNKVSGKYPELEHFMDSIEDMKANNVGINCPPEKTCECCCCQFKVKGI